MKIIVESKEDREIIEGLVDIALKAAGVKNLNVANLVMQSIVKPEKKEKKK